MGNVGGIVENKVITHNLQTGEVSIRDITEEEQAFLDSQSEIANEKHTKRQAVLEKLGLTEEELAIIFKH